MTLYDDDKEAGSPLLLTRKPPWFNDSVIALLFFF